MVTTMRKIFLFFLATLLLAQCGHEGSPSDNRSFSLDDFQRFDVDAFETLLGNVLKPGIVRVIGDDLVLTVETFASEMAVVRNLKSAETYRFLTKGRGPGECLSIRDVAVYGDSLFFSSIEDNKILAYHLDGDQINYSHDYSYDTWTLRAIPLPDKGILCLPLWDGRFIRIRDGKTDTLGQFPKVTGDKKALNNSSLQSLVGASPDGKYVCSAYQDIDCIEIYSDEFMSLIRLNGPEQAIPKVKVTETPFGNSFSVEPSKTTFRGFSSSNAGFVVGYIGQLHTDDDEAIRNIGDLLFFDWEGNCLKRFHLPEELVYFDIDWNRQRLIGILGGDEPKLVCCPLPLL